MHVQRRTLVLGDWVRATGRERPGDCGGLIVTRTDAAAFGSAVDAVVDACRGDDGVAGRLSAAGLRAECADRPGRQHAVWVARRAGEGPIGLACLRRSEAAGGVRHSLAWLLVHPAWRRRGVGRRLVGAAMSAARQEGATEVHVETRADWADASAFWGHVAAAAVSAAPPR